jgi:hypothetical protein
MSSQDYCCNFNLFIKCLEVLLDMFVYISLIKLECPVSQTGVSNFDSSNSAVSFVKYKNCLSTPLQETSRDFQRSRLRSRISTSVVHHSFGQWSQLRSCVLTPIVYPDSCCTPRLRSYIMASIVPLDFNRLWPHLSISIDSGRTACLTSWLD